MANSFRAATQASTRSEGSAWQRVLPPAHLAEKALPVLQGPNGRAPSLSREFNAQVQTNLGKTCHERRGSTQIAATSSVEASDFGKKQIGSPTSEVWQQNRSKQTSCESSALDARLRQEPGRASSCHRSHHSSLKHETTSAPQRSDRHFSRTSHSRAKPLAFASGATAEEGPGSAVSAVPEPHRKSGFLSFRVSALDDILGTCMFSDWGEGEDVEPFHGKPA